MRTLSVDSLPPGLVRMRRWRQAARSAEITVCRSSCSHSLLWGSDPCKSSWPQFTECHFSDLPERALRTELLGFVEPLLGREVGIPRAPHIEAESGAWEARFQSIADGLMCWSTEFNPRQAQAIYFAVSHAMESWY